MPGPTGIVSQLPPFENDMPSHSTMQDTPVSEATCWTLIQGAAAGNREDRSGFSHRYLPMVRYCFATRWKGSPLEGSVDDAVQDVFLECFRDGGVLAKADPERVTRFRAFLFGVVRNVAQREERRQGRSRARRASGSSFHPERFAARGDPLSKVFDRAWALSLIEQAGEFMQSRAASSDAAARRRVELLELRFQQGLAIHVIAARWNEAPDAVHYMFRKARKEYRECLREVVAFHNPGTAKRSTEELDWLLSLLE